MDEEWIRFRLRHRIDPTRFEELCHALLKAEGHRRVRHLGASGADGGVDVSSQGPDGKRWVTQCKRHKSLSPGVLEKEVRSLIKRPLDPPPQVFHLAATCDVSRTCEEALKSAIEGAPFPLEIANFWAISELVGFLRDDYPELCERFIGTPEEPVGPVWNVPFQRNEFFTGREDVLTTLHEALHNEGSAAIGQAISGLGGIGKTQTAVEFCYRYREDYRAVLWVPAETKAELDKGFVEIARRLDLPEKDAQEQEVTVQAVREWLGDKDGWLLVLDNADTPSLVEPYLPTPPLGHVLLTSRESNFDVLHMEPFKLEVFPRDDACRFLLKRARREDASQKERQAALELAEELGYLPLALEQAVAYISLNRSRFVAYLASFHRRRLQLLSEGMLRDYREPVATTWSLNFGQVAEESEAAAEILRVSAFLSPDQIPEELLIRGAERFRDCLSEALRSCAEDPLVLDQLLQALSRYSLIERDQEDESFSVHRMVQEVVRQSLEDSEKRCLAESMVAALSRAYPGQDVAVWPLCDRLVPHWRTAAEAIARLDLESEAAGTVLIQAGFYAKERARFSEAAPLYERAVKILEKVLGEEHPSVATSLNNLASLHQAQGEYTRAAPLLERALQIFEKVLGEEHPNTKTVRENYASLQKATRNPLSRMLWTLLRWLK